MAANTTRVALSVLGLLALGACPSTPDADAGVPERDAGFGVLLGACGARAGERAEAFAVLDLGHGSSIACLQRSGDVVLSVDQSNHWVLWGDDGLRLASGQTRPPEYSACESFALLRGETLALLDESGLNLRLYSATTGAPLATLTAGPAWGLSQDGSALWVGSPNGLAVFSATGASLFVAPGDYSRAKGFGVAGKLRIAQGSTLERFSLPDGTRTALGSFSGTFSSWFLDGSHFLTSLGTTVWVYSADATGPLVFAGLERASYQGQGDWLWRFVDASTALSLYHLDAGANPVQSFAPPFQSAIGSGHSVGLLSYGEPPFRVLQLGSSSVTTGTFTVNRPSLSAFAASDDGAWVVGSRNGGVWRAPADGGTAVPLGCGSPMSITGADPGVAAISTGSGAILLVDLRPDGGHGLRPAIDFYSSHVELSADGRQLVAAGSFADAQYWDDRSLRIYDPTDGGLEHLWNYTFSDYPSALFMDFSFSRDATRLSHLVADLRTYPAINSSRLTDTAGNLIATETTKGLMQLSPDGRYGFVAVPTTPLGLSTTELFTNGVLSGAVSGLAVGWVANDRLLVNVRTSGPRSTFVAAEVRDGAGALLQTTTLPALGQVSPISGSSLYDATTNATYDLVSGRKLWESIHPRPYRAAPAGSFAVYQQGSVICAEPW